jgi:hypothetical protein
MAQLGRNCAPLDLVCTHTSMGVHVHAAWTTHGIYPWKHITGQRPAFPKFCQFIQLESVYHPARSQGLFINGPSHTVYKQHHDLILSSAGHPPAAQSCILQAAPRCLTTSMSPLQSLEKRRSSCRPQVLLSHAHSCQIGSIGASCSAAPKLAGPAQGSVGMWQLCSNAGAQCGSIRGRDLCFMEAGVIVTGFVMGVVHHVMGLQMSNLY